MRSMPSARVSKTNVSASAPPVSVSLPPPPTRRFGAARPESAFAAAVSCQHVAERVAGRSDAFHPVSVRFSTFVPSV